MKFIPYCIHIFAMQTNKLTMYYILAITPAGYIGLGLLLFSLLLTRGILKRKELKGCLIGGYIFLVIFCILLLAGTFSIIGIKGLIESVQTYINGKPYLSVVYDYSSYESEDDEGNSHTMYTPHVKFTTKEGYEVTHKLGISSGAPPTMGDTYKVYYDPGNGDVFVISLTAFFLYAAASVLVFLLLLAIAGAVIYVLGFNMNKYYNCVSNFIFYFFIPLVMAGFDALLMYALFNPQPLWVRALLLVFVIMLTLGLMGYVKMLRAKGKPKFKRTSASTWSGDWED